jgi:hypothetical protein
MIVGGALAISVFAVDGMPAAEGASGARQGSAYRFSLDGKPFSPDAVTVSGRPGELAPGDLIHVGGFWLTLGEEHENRFRSAMEGILLELGDGRTRWVGVRVERNYGEGPAFVDGMALLSPDEVRGLWGVRAETWTRSCATKAAFLDLTRVHLTLGQSAVEGHDDLPELPSGLRYLDAMRFVGWKNLRKLRDLRYLDVLPESDFDARLIAGLDGLKVLRVSSGSLKHPEALAMLPTLTTLDLRNQRELTDLRFAKSLAQLQTLQIGWTGVRDLGPLSDLPRLTTIEADRSLVDRLPGGALPALERLNVVGAPVTAQTVAAFRQAHPRVRVRRGWNESLQEALRDVTRVRIGPGESCGLEAPASAYESTNPVEIAGLLSLFVVDEDQSGGICGCLGGASFEFFSRDQPLETTHLVCNSMLRWSGWPGDGSLAPANVPAVLDWLAERGVAGPRDEDREGQAREDAFQRKSARATAGWNAKLREAFERDGSVASQNPSHDPRVFSAVLASEVPAAADRIRLLLRILGADTGSWSGLDWQEVIAERLLGRFSRGALEAACRAALLGADRELRRGAARFWDGWQSPLEHWQGGREPALRSALLSVLQEGQSPDLRARAVSLLASWWAELPVAERDDRLRAALQDSSEPVRQSAILAAGQLQATWAEAHLLRLLGGQPATIIPLPPAPPDEVDATDQSIAPIVRGAPISEAEFAGLALGYLRSRRAQPRIDELAVETGSAMLRVARALFDDRCELLVAEDFRTKDQNQPLQLAAVESVVRCRGKNGLDLALGYRQATHWWEPRQVAAALRTMLLAGDPPGVSTLKAATTLPKLRGWYLEYGTEYSKRLSAN